MKNTLCLLLSFITFSGIAYSQTDTLTQAERNRQKITELRSKLTNLSEDSIANLEGQTIIPRLVRIEEKLDGLIADMEAMKSHRQTSVTPEKLDDFLKQLEEMLGNTKDDQTAQLTSSGVSSDKYYVVLESQRTLEQAQTAKEMYSLKSGEKLKIVKSEMHNWYYLVAPKSGLYAEMRKRADAERKEGVNAWCVRDSQVSEL